MTEDRDRVWAAEDFPAEAEEQTEDGVAIVEIVLILAVLVGLILVFRTQVTAIITSVFESINNTVSSII